MAIMNPSTPEQLAGYMLIINPVVCPKCFVRYPAGTKICSVCGEEIPQQGENK